MGDRCGQRGGESNGANLALVARVYWCPVDFIASAWAIVAVFSAIIVALNKALICIFSTSGVAAWCTGKEIDCKTSGARRAEGS
jgi:hypothetical protein